MRNRDLLIYGLTLSLSLCAHVGLFGGLGNAARRHVDERQRILQVAVVSKPLPAPDPAPLPPAPKPKPKPPAPKLVDLTKAPPPAIKEAPPPPTPSNEPAPEPARPVFGVSMRSTVGPGAGTGFAVRVGNTLMKEPEAEYTPPEAVKAYKPVPLHQITKLPRKRGECTAAYPARAEELRIEGQVKLEVDVGADGVVGEVRVVRGLGHGLDEAAVEALKRCRFAPGEVAGQAVPTRIPYTYTFVIED